MMDDKTMAKKIVEQCVNQPTTRPKERFGTLTKTTGSQPREVSPRQHCSTIPLDRDRSRDNTHPQNGDQNVTEKELLNIGKSLGSDWELVAENLGIDRAEVERIKLDNPTTEIRIFKMLLKWSRANPKRATRSVLKEEIMKTKHSNENKLQRFLIETYENHYLKMDITPFLPEEEENIENMFVPVEMKTVGHEEDINNVLNDIDRKNKTRPCNILITGAAGLGKTTLCKKIMHTWCTTFTHDAQSEEIHQQKGVKGKHTIFTICDAEFLRTFSYLFYISLRHAVNETSVEEMIIHQLLDECYVDTYKEIIANEYKRCLYIIDGLDEWHPAHVKTSTPKGSTIIPKTNSKCISIYTSRPWKIAESPPKSKDIDIEIRLKGIKKGDAENLVKKLVAQLNDVKCNSMTGDAFFKEIKSKEVMYLRTNPLILKLLVLTWFENKTLKETRTAIYVKIVDLIMKLFQDKIDENLIRLKFPRQTSHFAFTDLIAFHPQCTEFASALLSLSSFAYKTLKLSTSCVFTAPDMLDNGMTKSDIEICQKAGLLSKTMAVHQSITDRKFELSYIHRTFHEFFAAVHAIQHRSEIDHILEECTSVEAFGEWFNVIEFLCGFDADILRQVTEHVRHIADLRESKQELKIQNIVLPCIREAPSKFTEGENLYVRELKLNERSQLHLLKYIDLENVERLSVTSDTDHILNQCEDMANLKVLNLKPKSSLIPGKSLAEIPTILTKFTEQCVLTLTELKVKGYDCVSLSWNIFPHQSLIANIQLHSVKLTHSQVTQLLCAQPTLQTISLVEAKCKRDETCGCKAGTMKHAKTYSSMNSRPLAVKKLSVYQSSDVLLHVNNASALTSFKYGSCNINEDFHQLVMNLLPTSVNIEKFELSKCIIEKNINISKKLTSLVIIDMNLVQITSQSLRNLITKLASLKRYIHLNLIQIELLSGSLDEFKKWVIGYKAIQSIKRKRVSSVTSYSADLVIRGQEDTPTVMSPGQSVVDPETKRKQSGVDQETKRKQSAVYPGTKRKQSGVYLETKRKH